MTSKMYRAVVAVVFTVITFGSMHAESSSSFVPGLLHGSAPGVLIAELLPTRSIAGKALPAVPNFGHYPTHFQSTFSLDAVAGPLGVSSLLKTSMDPDCNDLWGPDKWRHLGVWFAGTLGIYLFFKTIFKTSKLVSYLLSATVMTALGVAREISDSNSEKNCFSEQDLLANTLGILSVGVVITIF